jgi:heme exporter protein CcmD
MNEFLEMGGYARYVWSAFGVSLIVLTGMIYLTKRSLRNTRAQLARRLHSMTGASS